MKDGNRGVWIFAAVIGVLAVGAVAAWLLTDSPDQDEYWDVLHTDGELAIRIADASEVMNGAITGFPDVSEEQIAVVRSVVETFTAIYEEANALEVPEDLQSGHNRMVRGFEYYVEGGNLTLLAIEEGTFSSLGRAMEAYDDGIENISEGDRLLERKRISLGLE